MWVSLVLTGLLLGLTSGLHCVGMCGALCSAVGGTGPKDLSAFHAGRAVAYSGLGVIVAVLAGALSWALNGLGAVKYAMVIAPAVSLVYGLFLLVFAKSPIWAAESLAKLRQKCDRVLGRSAFSRGLAWVIMPCGMLYAALALAMLGDSAGLSALVMLSFWAGTTVWLVVALLGWRRLRRLTEPLQHRIAGAALCGGSGMALWHALTQSSQLFCLP